MSPSPLVRVSRALLSTLILIGLTTQVAAERAADLVGLRVSPTGEAMAVGDTRSYHATAVYSDSTSADVTDLVTWSAASPATATVDAAGIVTAWAIGETNITASYSGFTATAALRVRGVDAYLYASSWGLANGLHGYTADLITGQLTTDLGTAAGELSPWAVAIDPGGRWAFMTNREGGTVQAFAIDANTGTLTPIGSYPTGGQWPYSAVVEPTGRFLYVGNYLGSSIAAYAIGGDGSLTPVPGSPVAVPGVVAMAAHPSGEFLYFSTGGPYGGSNVPGDHSIAAYRIGANGALTAVPGSPFWFDGFGAYNNLLGLTAHRSGRFLIASDNSTHSIRVFGIEPATGALTGEAFRLNDLSLSRGILAHPNGQHVIAAGYNGINVFTLDTATGALTAVAGSPFASSLNPQALALDHSGTRLYGVNGDQSGGSAEVFSRISQHYFDPASGVITRFATLDAGGTLMGIAITGSNGPSPALSQIDVAPLDPTVLTTVFGISRSFTATGTYSDGRSGPLAGAAWASSNTAVAEIHPVTGVATLKAYGTATITATRSGVSGSTTLTVAPAPLTNVYVSPIAAVTAPGGTRQFKATALYADGQTVDATAAAAWASSQPGVATVSGGLALGVSPGATTVSATFEGLTAGATLVVKGGATFAFAVDRTGAKVYAYQRTGGTLAAATGSPFGGVGTDPAAIALDPSGRLLYVADSANNRLYGFQVDGQTGQLLPAPGSPVPTRQGPGQIAIDPLGRFLYVANRFDARVSAFAIDGASGQLTAVGVDQDLPVTGGRSLAIDAAGRFLYVGAGGGNPNDGIRIYRIDQATGALTRVGDVTTGPAPDAIVSDPAGRFLYVANAFGSTVSQYAINPATGALTPVGSFAAGMFPTRLAFHPSGSVLYVGVNFGGWMTSFAVSPGTGALTQVQSEQVFGGVRNAVVEPSGEYLYVSGEFLTAYAVDATGAFTKIQDYAAGTNPVGVTVGTLAPAAPVTLSSLAVVPGSATVYGSAPGGTRQFIAVGTYSDGSHAFLTHSATWSSSDPAVAVSATGQVAALAVPASATITAAIGGTSTTATFTASNTPARLVVTPRIETIGVGFSRTFRTVAIYPDNFAEDVTSQTAWMTSDATIASVAADGTVSGVAHGDATITASYLGITGEGLVQVRSVDAYLYASRWGVPEGVKGQAVDLISGQLTTDLGIAPSAGAPWTVAIDPRGRFTYVTNREAGTVSAFAIDAATGVLTPIDTYASGGQWPYSALVDPTGRFLYVGNLQGKTIAAFAIGADGSLTPVPGSPFDVPGVVAMAAHPSGEFLYFSTGGPYGSSATPGDHKIAVHRIGADGALTAVPGSPFWFDDFGNFTSLAGLAVHRSGRYLLASDNPTGSIRVFRLDVATGALTGEASRFNSLYLSKGILTHPNGQHVIAAGFDGIHVFTLDAATGVLTRVPGSPFSSSFFPQALALDHTGTRLYGVNGDQIAPGGGFGAVSLHYIDPATGIVTRFNTVEYGGALMGIGITASNAPGPSLVAIAIAPAAPIVETTVFGITRAFTAVGTYSDGRSGPLGGATWQSSDTSVATIDASTGVATLKGYGTTTISATRSGVVAQTTLEVVPAPVIALYLSPIVSRLGPGVTRQLTASALHADGIALDVSGAAAWSSSAPGVATVVAGLVSTNAAGTATITATYAGFPATATIVVKSGAVAAYTIDRIGGLAHGYLRAIGGAGLVAAAGSPYGGVGASPNGIVLDPTGRLLFVADTPNNRVHAFQVDGATGGLLPAPGSPFATRNGPAYLAVDPLGRFLYVSNVGDLRMSAFAIDPTGRLTPIGVDQNLAYVGRSLTVDAGGRFLYVGTGQSDGNDRIRVFRIDQVTGSLTTVGDVASGFLAEDLATDPSGRFVYAAIGMLNVVRKYEVHQGTGMLTPVSSTVANAPYRLALHPSGQVLYVGSRDATGLTSFVLSPVTGEWTPVTTVPVFGGLSDAAMDPLGDFLYVTGERLALYAVDASGALNKIQDYDAGSLPAVVTTGVLAPAAPETVASLSIVPASITIHGQTAGATRQLSAIATFTGGSQAFLTQSASWSSSDPSAISVSATGMVTVLSVPSSVTITAAFGGQIATATVSASNVPASLRLLPIDETMSVGATRAFRATAVYPDGTTEDVSALVAWSSSNPAVATVDGLGAVTGLAIGDATITVAYLGAGGAATARVRGLDAYLYVSRWGGFPPGVGSFRVDLASGQITTELATAPSGSAPWAVAIDPRGRFTYVTNREDGTVSAYAIGTNTGVLTPIDTYPSGGQWPYSALVDPTGRFLYVGNMLGKTIAAFAIGADGSLTPVPGSPFAVPGVVAMAAHPSGEFLYFSTGGPYGSSATPGDHKIAVHRIGADGALTAVPGSPFWFDDFGNFTSLAGLAVHRSGRYLLASDNPTGSIRVFRLDVATGALTGEASRFNGLYLSKGILAHPNGLHVIAAGFDGVHVFTLDAATGVLTRVPGSPFSSTLFPQALALDHTGTRLYGANGDQIAPGGDFSSISLHSFDPATGVVTRFGTLNATGALMGIALTPGLPADVTPPPAPIITLHPIDPSPPSTAAFVFAFSDAEAGVTFECRLDVQPFAPCSSPHGYGGLPPGAHTFAVRAVDTSGNRSTQTAFTWTVDAPYPTAFSNLTASHTIVYGTPSVTVSGTISAPGPLFPQTGDIVSITLNGMMVFASIAENGAFTAALPTQGLPASPGAPYPITYAYGGSVDLQPVTDNSTTLTVLPAAATIVVSGYTGVFDGLPHGATGTATGVFGEDLSAYLNLGAVYVDAPGGPAHWTFQGHPNYLAASGDVNIVITPLTRLATAFSNLSASQTVSYGTPSIVVSGTIAAPGPIFPPPGETVTIIVNASPVVVPIGVNGSFNATLPIAGLPVVGSPYAITYLYGGNADFLPTSDGSTTLTIAPATATIVVTGFTGVYDGQPHGATGTATGVFGENLGVFLDLGATFTEVPGGTAHWTFAGNPNYQPAAGNVAIVITPVPGGGSPDGEMHGAGFVAANGKHHFEFRVVQHLGSDSGRFEYWITDVRDQRGTPARFKATAVDAVTFADSVTFRGRGTWNGQSGYAFEVTARDNGEPGRRDTIAVVIKAANGTVVATVSGTLEGGNIQSKR